MSVNVPADQWRLRTPGGIPYKLISLNGSFGEEEATATEVVLIEAGRLIEFATESFPGTFPFTSTVFQSKRRSLPGAASLVSRNVSWEAIEDGKPIDPFGADSGAPDGTYHDIIRVTVQHGTSQRNDEEEDPSDPKTFLEISANASGVFLTSSPTGFAQWEIGTDIVETAKEADIPQTQTETETEWTTRWSQIPADWFDSVLIGRLRGKLGKVNEGEMTTLYNAPAETVLFVGFSLSQQYTWRDDRVGQSPLRLDLKFLEKNMRQEVTPGVHWEGLIDGQMQVTHNHIYRPGVGYRRLLIDNKPLYQSTSLDDIFTSSS